MKKGLDINRLRFGTAFKYPFNRPKGLLNILWLLLPIFGWFALAGYVVRIIQEFSKGQFKKLPVMSFGSDMKLGFFMFLKALPFIIAYLILIALLDLIHPILGEVADILVSIFVIPILAVNFINKETVGSFFEFEIVRSVFNNLLDYITAIVKDIVLAIVYVIMIIVLVGIPAGAFTQSIFIADFYRRKVMKSSNKEPATKKKKKK